VTADLSLQKLLQTAHDAIGQVNQEDWEGFCRHVESLEKQYWGMAGIVPDVIDSIVVNLGSDSDSVSESDNGAARIPVKIQAEEVSRPTGNEQVNVF
jgi:hypothetical protein